MQFMMLIFYSCYNMILSFCYRGLSVVKTVGIEY